MSVRKKYRLEKIRSEIENYEAFIDAELFDEAVRYFREYLEKPTLFGLEPSLKRSELLQKIELEKLSSEEDKCYVLYSLALTLNLTGGYPNRALPLYQNHNKLAERIGNYKSLSQSLGHYAKALRQVGRFYESEVAARQGLKIVRDCGDFLREAVNLYWLGMGLAQRGESRLSEIALQRCLRIFQQKFAEQSAGVVFTFLGQRALWLELYDEALECADKALEIGRKLKADENHADLHGAVKILTAAWRMKGEALIHKNEFRESEVCLQAALSSAEEIDFVEETLPALRALALKSLREDNPVLARRYLRQTWNLAERGQFQLYNADSYNILARVEMSAGTSHKALEAARKAFALSICDGIPFAYERGLADSIIILNKLGTGILEIPECDRTDIFLLTDMEINPDDEFSG